NLPGSTAHDRKDLNATRELGVRRCVVRILFDGLLKIADSRAQGVGRCPIQKELPLQIRLISFQVGGALDSCPYLLAWTQRAANLLRDSAGDFILQSQDIFYVSFVALRPEMLLLRRLDQLSRNANLVARPHDRTFHNRLDM